jgi:hypothetical protein
MRSIRQQTRLSAALLRLALPAAAHHSTASFDLSRRRSRATDGRAAPPRRSRATDAEDLQHPSRAD